MGGRRCRHRNPCHMYVCNFQLFSSLSYNVRRHLIFFYVSAAKPSKPEGPLVVSDIHKEGCKLKWNRPKDDGGVPLEGYVVEKYDPDTGIWLPVGKTKDPEME